jgi:membrane protein DedA with SNARE-associated domain
MPPRRWERVFNAVVWVIAVASSFYAASRHLTAKQHMAGAVAGSVVLVVIALVINVISSRRRHRGGT